MKRALWVAIAVILGACAVASEDGPPEGLALADSTATSSADVARNLMRFEIGEEPFVLSAGICNTYDDGTFRFALAEGPVENVGHATATIERFDNGSSYEMIIVLEGTRDDDSDVSWYARGSVPAHDLTVSVIGSSVEGSAIFDSIGGPETSGEKALGDFSISCS